MSLKSTKAIWDYLKAEYAGDERICGIKVLNLIREFELQRMNEPEIRKRVLWQTSKHCQQSKDAWICIK